MDPITAAVLVSAIGGGASAIGSRMGRSRAQANQEEENRLNKKESKRERRANALSQAHERKSDLVKHHVNEKKRLSEKKASGMHETADLVRQALKL